MKRKRLNGTHRNGRHEPKPPHIPVVPTAPTPKVLKPTIIQDEKRPASRQNNGDALKSVDIPTPTVASFVDWAELRTAPSVRVTSQTEMEYNDPNQEGPQPVDRGKLALMHAFGTKSPDFFESIIAQLKRVTSKNGWLSERDLNFVIGVIAHFKPANHVDLMLAEQIGALHLAALRFVPELINAQSPEEIVLFERAVTRLFRTSAMLLDSFTRRKSGERNDRTAAKPRNQTHSPKSAPEMNRRADPDSADDCEQASAGNGTHTPMQTVPENGRIPKSNGSGASHNSQTSAVMPGRPRSH